MLQLFSSPGSQNEATRCPFDLLHAVPFDHIWILALDSESSFAQRATVLISGH